MTETNRYNLTTALTRAAAALICLWLAVAFAAAADRGKYTGLIDAASKMTSGRALRRADALRSQGRTDEAMVLYMVICGRTSPDMTPAEREACAAAHLKAGDLCYGRGDYVRALEFYVNGLKMSEEGGESRHAAKFYKNIGNVYCQFSDYGKGAESYKRGYSLCKKYPDADTERKILMNLTGLYIYTGKPAVARKYLEATLRMKDTGDKVSRFMNEYNRALIDAAEGRAGEAIPRFRRLAGYASAEGLPPQYVCYALQELYKAFDKTGMADSAMHYLDLCEKNIVANGLRHLFVDQLKDASAIYEAAGQAGKSMEYKAAYLTVSDSILNQRRFDAAKNVQFSYEMEKAGKEISSLRTMHEASRQTISRQRTAMILGLVTILAVTAFLVVLYRQNKKLNNSYADLYALNAGFIARQEEMKKRHADCLARISGLEAEAAALREAAGTANGADGEKPAHKYGSSNLDDARQQALAEAITAVMDNGCEFCSPDFSLDRLAALVGSNNKYVSQVINGTYNKNFSNFVNEYRIRTACKRLADTDRYGHLTVKAVGESVGYRSHTTFVNIFRKMTGLTPSLYQKMAKSNQ